MAVCNFVIGGIFFLSCSEQVYHVASVNIFKVPSPPTGREPSSSPQREGTGAAYTLGVWGVWAPVGCMGGREGGRAGGRGKSLLIC